MELTTRRLRPEDMNSVVALDAKIVGRRRDEYFKTKLKMALADTGVDISLAAEMDGVFVGFLLARVYYGEFGSLERTAVVDTLNVHPDFRDRGVGKSLFDQLRQNLTGLRISQLQTQVHWEDQALLSFFHHHGFRLSQRLCLELDLERGSPEG